MDAGHIHAALTDLGITKIVSVRMGTTNRATWEVILDATATAEERAAATSAVRTVVPLTDREQRARSLRSDPVLDALLTKGVLVEADVLDAGIPR